jgi:DNA-binding IclR family transcriptional regulator
MPRKAQTPSIADQNAASGGVAAVDRALSLLATFSVAQSALTLGELSALTQLYKSTVLRLLASLLHRGLMQQRSDGRYALGPEVARLHAAYASSFSLADVVIPALQSLVVATHESAAFHVRQGQARLCLYRIDSPHPVRDHIKAGDLLPIDRGAGARVLDAFADPQDRLPDRRNAARAKAVAQRGYFAGVGDRDQEVAGISAPVFAAGGKLAGALTLTTPANRYQEAHVPCVLAAAAALSKALGYNGASSVAIEAV